MAKDSDEPKSRADQVRAADEGSTAGAPRSRADQVRAAVEQAFGATAHGAAPMRERAQELADELVGAASRVREVLEELRPPSVDEVAALRAQVEALEQRVAALEAQAAEAKPAAAPKPRSRTTRATAGGAKGASASPGASTAKRGKSS